jgi:hypothetical protein
VRFGVTFATDFAELRLPLTDQDLAFVTLPNAKDIAATGWAKGQAVTLSAIQRGKLQQWQAYIVRSEGIVDESSRVTYAVARIDDPYQLNGDGTALPMGTFVVAKIAGTMAPDAIRVPQAAIRGANQLIFLDDDDKIRIREVRIMRSDADFAYLSSGASPGDRIVLTALENPINGTQVRTSEAGGEPQVD